MVDFYANISSGETLIVFPNWPLTVPFDDPIGITYFATTIPLSGGRSHATVGLKPNWPLDEVMGQRTWNDHTENSILHDNFKGTLEIWDETSHDVHLDPDGYVHGLNGKGRFQWKRIAGQQYMVATAPCSYEWTNEGFATHVALQVTRSYNCTPGAVATIMEFNDGIYNVDHPTVRVLLTDLHHGLIRLGSADNLQQALDTFWDEENTSLFEAYILPGYTSSAPAVLKLHKLGREILQGLADLIRERVRVDVPDLDAYGELVTRATSNCLAVSANSLATSRETLALRQEVTSLTDEVRYHLLPRVYKKSRGKRNRFKGYWLDFSSQVNAGLFRNLQRMLNLRLSLKWGLPLTVADLTQISSALTKRLLEPYQADANKWRAVYSRREEAVTFEGWPDLTGSLVRSMKVIYRDKPNFSETKPFRDLADFRVGSLTVAWDLIPYSFVVDWFIRVEDVLDQIDMLHYRQAYFDLWGSVRGWRLAVHLTNRELQALELPNLPTMKLSGEVDVVLYTRRVLDTVALPTCRFSSPGIGVDQWIDGLSLIQQRL